MVSVRPKAVLILLAAFFNLCWESAANEVSRESYFWHFNRNIPSAAALGPGKARSCWCNHIPETSKRWTMTRKHDCSQFCILVCLCLVQKIKSSPHWCQQQKLESIGAGQVFAQRPQNSSPGVTFFLVPIHGLTPSSNGFLLKELVNSVNLPPWDRLVLSTPIGCNDTHSNLLKSLHEGWAWAGDKGWFLAMGQFLLVGCHDLLHLRNQNDPTSISQSDWKKRL